MDNFCLNKKGNLKFISIHLGNPFKRRPTQINFLRWAFGFSLFGGWLFAIVRGIDIKTMDANPWYNKHGVKFDYDTIWCKPGKGYYEMGWGVYWHSKK